MMVRRPAVGYVGGSLVMLDRYLAVIVMWMVVVVVVAATTTTAAAVAATTTTAAAVAGLKYSVVPGFFLQSGGGFDIQKKLTSFGLEREGPDRWTVFRQQIQEMNDNAEEGVSFRVLYLGRHGQGQHNVAEEFFGPKSWECYWAMQTTNGSYTWGPDAQLTPQGITEVLATSTAYAAELAASMPAPESHYVSPLSRALSTLALTWQAVVKDSPNGVVKESLRETLGLHIADHRSSKSALLKTHPTLVFSPSFTETDTLWTLTRESEQHRNERVKKALDGIFKADNNTFITVTAHSGVINSTLWAVGHRDWRVETAGMVPVVVRVEVDEEKEKEKEVELVGDDGRDEEGYGVELRSVCEGFKPVNVSGRYENGMGVWPYS